MSLFFCTCLLDLIRVPVVSTRNRPGGIYLAGMEPLPGSTVRRRSTWRRRGEGGNRRTVTFDGFKRVVVVPFLWEEYEALSEIMGRAKGKVIMTINDHPKIRQQFSRFRSEPVEARYTVGGGGDRSKMYRELIYFNW